MRGWETPTLFIPLETTNRIHSTTATTYVSLTAALYKPAIRVCQREITGKKAIKIVKTHLKA
jgi:hypothetical protein